VIDKPTPMPCDLPTLKVAVTKLDLGLKLTPAQFKAWQDRPPPVKSAEETGSAADAPSVADVGTGATNPTQAEVQDAQNEGGPF
jgi:hypothetical protein